MNHKTPMLRCEGFWPKLFRITAVFQSSVICFFTLYAVTPTDLAKALTAATAFPMTPRKYLRQEKEYSTCRAFNNRLGLPADTYAREVLTSTIGGPNEDLPNLKTDEEYYELRKWEDDGWALQGKSELGLDFVIMICMVKFKVVFMA